MNNEFKRELREGIEALGFRPGARVLVNGRVGTVTSKMVRGPDNIVQGVKFDEPNEHGKHFGAFPHTELFEAPPAEGKPTEVDLLGQRIRST